MTKVNNEKGLTLLEIIISITLSVVIFVILFSAMRLAYKSQASGEAKAELTQKMRITGDRLTWLVRGAYPFMIRKPDEKMLFFSGESDSLGFVTTSVDSYGSGPEDMAGLKWVYIFHDDDGLQIREKVFFLEDVFDNDDGKIYTLDKSVTDLEFEYLDIPEDEDQGDWVTDWDPEDKDYLPAAVKIKLYFTEEEKEIPMPELLVTIQARKRENI